MTDALIRVAVAALERGGQAAEALSGVSDQATMALEWAADRLFDAARWIDVENHVHQSVSLFRWNPDTGMVAVHPPRFDPSGVFLGLTGDVPTHAPDDDPFAWPETPET